MQHPLTKTSSKISKALNSLGYFRYWTRFIACKVQKLYQQKCSPEQQQECGKQQRSQINGRVKCKLQELILFLHLWDLLSRKYCSQSFLMSDCIFAVQRLRDYYSNFALSQIFLFVIERHSVSRCKIITITRVSRFL